MNNSFLNLIAINSLVSQRGNIFQHIFCVFKIVFLELYCLTVDCVA